MWIHHHDEVEERGVSAQIDELGVPLVEIAVTRPRSVVLLVAVLDHSVQGFGGDPR